MKKLMFNEQEYLLIQDYKNGFDIEVVTERLTEYFAEYDYVFGDWAYGKLRMKGFCKKENPNLNKTNDYDNLNQYIKEYCAFECKYFVLEKVPS